MSTAIRAGAQPISHPNRGKPSRRAATQRLRLVVPSIAKRGIPFTGLCLGLIMTAVIGVLLANISISHSSYRVNDLSRQNEDLHAQRDRLAEDISYRQSPQNIRKAAQALGMEQDLTPSYLMPDGSIIESDAVAESKNNDTSVPAPRADARDDVRPNLRSDDILPAIGDDGGSDLESPKVNQPK